MKKLGSYLLLRRIEQSSTTSSWGENFQKCNEFLALSCRFSNSERRGEMIKYFEIQDIKGIYFTCSYYGTMSTTSCAQNYAKAPRSSCLGRLQSCIGCSIGATHAPDSVETRLSHSTATLQSTKTFCTRCRRGGERNTNKLIGRLRLVRNGTICVSCYNREREVKIGKNAKGTPPKKWMTLFSASIAIVTGSNVTIKRPDHLVKDRLEIIYEVFRDTKDKSTSVAWAPTLQIFKK